MLVHLTQSDDYDFIYLYKGLNLATK